MSLMLRLTSDELEALAGVRHDARLLYLLGLRPYMDFKTGVVGVKRRVSYQGFRELLEVFPDRGSAAGAVQSPTKSALRALLLLLERHGLIEKLAQRRRIDPMVFKLPFADCDENNRLGEQRHKSDIGQATQQTAQEKQDNNNVNQLDSDAGMGSSDIEQRHSKNSEQRHTSVLPFTTTTTKHISIAREAETRLAGDWLPSIEVMTRLARDEFVEPAFVDEYTTEFVMYWSRSGMAKMSWDAVFFRQCLDQWKRRRFSWCQR